MTKHPITPPTELVHKWALEAEDEHQPTVAYSLVGQLAAKAAQWGADQELEACCKWQKYHLLAGPHLNKQLRAARRPKPTTLKEQALEALDHILHNSSTELGAETIRRALEAL